MIAVIFEAQASADTQAEYLDLAAQLRPHLARIDGFLSIERFASLTTPGKVLSLSFWRDEAAVMQWRNLPDIARRKRRGVTMSSRTIVCGSRPSSVTMA